MAGAILAFDDKVRPRESVVDVAFIDVMSLERRVEASGSKIGVVRPVVDPHVGGGERLAVVVGEQQDRLGDVPHARSARKGWSSSISATTFRPGMSR